jgi:dynactin complex subunit
MKAYDSEKNHIDWLNHLVTGRKSVKGTTRQRETIKKSYTIKRKLLDDYVIDVSLMKMKILEEGILT